MSQFDINKAKARIAGFTTSLNNKITGAENLVDQVLGPPILKSETVRAQLNQRLDEVQEAWLKLKALLDEVVDYYIENPADDSAGAKSKTSGADHYIHYRGEKSCKYDECRSKLIMAIAK